MNKTINKWLSFLLLMLVGTVGTSAQTLEVEDFSIKADEVKEVTLVYKGDAAMIGYQTDIELSEGLVFETQPVDKTGKFSLDMKSLGEVDGATKKARLVATSTAGATEVAAGSDLLTLSIKIKGTESFERGTLKLTNQEIVLAGNTPVNPADFTCNITLQGDEPGPEGGKFVLYTGALVPGDYIIYYGGKAMNTTTDKNRLQYEVVTPVDNAITDAPANIIWTIAADGDYFTLYNAAEQVYAVSTGAKNQATTAAEVTDNARWTFTEDREFVNLANTNASVNANLRNNGDYGFAAYGTTTGGTLSLYKKVGADEVVVAMPTITPSASFETSQTVEITAEEGATIYYTTDGTDPTAESTAYTEALTITETTTVKAIAVKDGVSSEVASATFTKVEPVEPITIAEAQALEMGAEAFIKGVVVASAANGAVIYDGTDYIYYYNTANALEVGKSVSVKGVLGNYGGANQFTYAATVTEIDDLNLAIPTEAKALTADDLDDAATDGAAIPRQLATIEGSFSISGNYFNIAVEGTETAVGAIVKPMEDVSALDGKVVKVTGYEMYVTNNKFVYFVATSIEEVQPEPTTYSIIIDENIENGDVVADVETAEAGATVTLTITPAEGYELDAVTATYTDETGADQTITLAEDNSFTMPEADVNITATFKAVEPEVPVVEEGVYYIYNEASGKFLSRGSSYGTRAVGDNYGLPINVVRTEEGKYNLQLVDNQAYYGDDYWMYADCSGDRMRAYTIEETEGGYVFINPNHGMRLYIYLKDDADKYAIAGNATLDENISDWNQTVWQLLTQDERDAIVEEREAEEKITALIKGGIPADAIEENLTEAEATALTFKTGSAWTFTAVRDGSYADTNDNGTEVYQGTGNFTQTVSGLEAGVYKVTVQAFFRDGWNEAVAANYDLGYNLSNAYLDANGSTAAILSWGADRASDGNPNSMGEAAALFADGKYISETYAYVGEDGNLNLTIYQPNFIGGGWFIANEVTYAKVAYDNTSSIDTDLTEEMFHEWDAVTAGANITGNVPNIYFEKHFGEEVAAGGTVYGNGNVKALAYADLSEYSNLTITRTAESAGLPRLLFNRTTDTSTDYIEISSADNKYVTASEDGLTWTIDLAKLVEDAEYAHLNVFKSTGGGVLTITSAVLSKVSTLYTVTIDENMENGAVEADKTEAEVEETVTLTVTPEDGYELTELLVTYPVATVDATTSEVGVEMVDVVTIPNDDGTYSFTMPAANVTVEATFAEITNNWTFDENPNDVITATTRTYYKDCQEGDVSGLQHVSRWSEAEMSENPGVIGGIFAYGSENKLNDRVTAPAKDPEESEVGSALGLVAVWTQIAQYTQPITLPSGNYKFTYTVYNALNTGAVEKNLFGFIAADGTTEYLSDKKTFTEGKWETVEVTFTLETETTGNLSVGYVSANDGSGSQPHLFVDNINLEEVSGKDVAQAALEEEIEKAEAAIDGYVIGDNVFQYPETEIQPLIDAVKVAQDVLDDEDATAEELKTALDNLKEAEEAFDPQFNEPVEGQAYNFTLTTSEGTFQLKIDGTANSIAEEGTPVYLVDQQDGTYAITADNTNYVVYEGSNKWTMSTSTEPYGWTITALEDGGYTIAGQNGLYGTNTSDGNAAGSTIYGDKNTSNGNVVWNIEAVQTEPVTTSYTGTLTQTLSHPQAGEMGKEETDNYKIKISEPDAEGNVTITYVGGFTFPVMPSTLPEFTVNAKQTVAEDGTITYTNEAFTVGVPMGQMTVNYNASLTGTQKPDETTPTITLVLQNATTNTVVFGPMAENHEINETETENGSISTDVEEAKEGDKVTITPTAEQGFEVDVIKVTYQTTDDQGLPVTVDVPVTKNEDGTYSFIMPDAPVTIVTTFKTATGINTVSASAEAVSDALRNGRVFDLSGRKIRTINNGGIYIVNGKKMMIK